ncbi:RlpA-like double-psi beta-barrel domain-containing protein [Streptomyces guryensis]|uniref:RlpA-like double-psi beta-barrel domain-containing protein n=1 Tax=Streptomyces guryensis TaxID=2886947 RepID=A0A9Q3VRK4_9ACTN|nr:RlpA-like double-psi beta-barrel domain-containing protein [Streptomyces guryensis]MCD9875695.1 RlpA-like double-psi beta-barrel domain-containing protein [Streptomyces guryensis]
MRTTKHAAPQPWRRRGPVTGIPLGLPVIGVPACLALTVRTGSGTGIGRAADAAAAGVRAATPSGVGSAAGGGAGATVQLTASASPAIPASASATPSPSATPAASATSTAPASSRAAALAGRIRPAVSYQGAGTAYAAGDGSGSCRHGPSDDLMAAAMNVTDDESAKACGAHVLVRAAGGATITVRIGNECPWPCAPGRLDLSRQAFAKLADLSVGRLPMTWSLLSPDLPGTIAIRYKSGSTKWWRGIQVIGHPNPVAALEVRTAGGRRRLPRTDHDYFLSADGTSRGGALGITDIHGERLTVDGLAVRPDVTQPTGVQCARH